MKKIVPYVIFAVVYVSLGCLLGAATGEISDQTTSWILSLLAPVAAAPAAMMLARRAGRLAASGLLVATIVSALVVYVLITAIFSAMTLQPDVITLLSLARVGGWRFALSNVIFVLAPWLWLPLLKRRRPRTRQRHAVA